MDKYEYKLKLDEIKSLASEKNYEAAVEIVDSMNWRKVRNVNALVLAGEVYEHVKRYDESRDVLLMAYDRSPIGKKIIYRLAKIAIKTGNFDEAQDYYNEFVEIAPHDSLKYILRYRISQAKSEPYSAQIAILEELKEQEYTEEWAYELAHLYHVAGMADACVEACDELILWFGDGAFVEKALELKMLYQPLNPVQEEKYKNYRLKHGAMVEVKADEPIEVRADEALESGEIVPNTIQIPAIKTNTDRFNTQNLQEELAKSMQQIMEATEQETVSDTMDNIKKLAQDIPYLQDLVEESRLKEEELFEAEKVIEGSLQLNFREYLEEDSDGQISLYVPENAEPESQITGQMTIEDVLAEWEKTKKAAEAAMQEAEKRRLELSKTRALQEAGDIMDRLAEVMPHLESGDDAKEILEQASVEQTPESEKAARDAVAGMSQRLQKELNKLQSQPEEALVAHGAIAVAKAAAQADEAKKPVLTGVEQLALAAGKTLEPEVAAAVATGAAVAEAVATGADLAEIAAEPKAVAGSETLTAAMEAIEEAEDIDIEDIAVEDIEEFDLDDFEDDDEEDQEESEKEDAAVEKTPEEEPAENFRELELEPEHPLKQPTKRFPDLSDIISDGPFNPASQASALQAREEAAEPGNELLEGIVADAFDEWEQQKQELEDQELEEQEIKAQEDEELQAADTAEDTAAGVSQKQPESHQELTETAVSAEVPEVEDTAAYQKRVQREASLEKIAKNIPQILKKETVLEKEDRDFTEISEEQSITSLDEEQREVFTYFLAVTGMEQQICKILSNTGRCLKNGTGNKTGNILIQGIGGSGKTMLATGIIKCLQELTGKPNKKIGKITADALNHKDITALVQKIKGGCLIIEKAGELSRESAVKLSLLMENAAYDVLIIMEDSKEGLRQALAKDDGFSRKFTEKITIPYFTNDELVAFGRTYANESGYGIDEMGILALYRRISSIQKLDQATTLIEIKEIIDEAIGRVEKGGIKKVFGILTSKRYDENNYVILREKDLEG